MTKNALSILLMLIGLWIILVIIQFDALFSNINNKSEVNPINSQVVNTENYRGSLVFKMIDYDLKNGITNKINEEKAKKNVAFYYSRVRDKCHRLNDSEYLRCANDILGNYFYYTQSQEVSNNYAKQQSDCDLNSYMIYDVASMANIDVSLVYAPSHAFIAWRNENGLYDYLETTENKNHGSIPNLSDRLYRKTFDKTYYTPVKSSVIYSVYKSLVYDLVPRDLNVNIDSDIKRNSIIFDSYLLSKENSNTLSLSDIQNTQTLLKTDITSAVKKMVVAKWYFEHHDNERAKRYVKSIKNEDCKIDCVELKMKIQPQFRLWYSLYPAYNRIALRLDANVSVNEYIMAIMLLIFSVLTIASLWVYLRLRLREKKEEQMN